MPEKTKINEKNLRLMEMRQKGQFYSYDLTQKLTFFVISIELFFSGYILLNAEKFGPIKFSTVLFIISSMAALFGILWRVCYNEVYHRIMHGKPPKDYRSYKKCRDIAYWFYVPLTFLFLVGIVLIGSSYLNKYEEKTSVNSKIKKIEIINHKIQDVEGALLNISKSIDKLVNMEPQFQIVVEAKAKKEKDNKDTKRHTSKQ